jgi:hypothetical protein
MPEIDLIKIARDINHDVTKAYREGILLRNVYGFDFVFSKFFFPIVEHVFEKNGIEQYSDYKYTSMDSYFEHERMKVDRSVWKTKYSSNHPSSTQKNVWKFELLLEHENKGTRWIEEMRKLCFLNAPFKMIITYGRTKEGGLGLKETPKDKGIQLIDIASEIITFTEDKSFELFIIMFGEESVNLDMLGNKSIYDIWICKKGETIFSRFE